MLRVVIISLVAGQKTVTWSPSRKTSPPSPGWLNWILHRKFKHSVCCLIELFLLLWYLWKSILNPYINFRSKIQLDHPPPQSRPCAKRHHHCRCGRLNFRVICVVAVVVIQPFGESLTYGSCCDIIAGCREILPSIIILDSSKGREGAKREGRLSIICIINWVNVISKPGILRGRFW